jgi:ABC-type antimicrobial peptide transport system permease subunit
MADIIGQVTKESFFMGLLMFVLGFAAAFIGFYLWKQIQAVNPDAADVIGLAA